MKSVDVLGDTHLGRRFRTGVPLHRLGDRENLVREQFEHELLEKPKRDIHVHMGDLFDKYIVGPEIVIHAATVYQEAAEKFPNTTFVVLEGNHDTSRDVTKRSSFDLFEALVRGTRNIWVVQDRPSVIGGIGFVPYNAFHPTAELVAELPDGLLVVFGHWDIQDWGGDNVIPTELLAAKGIQYAFSGHDHLKRELTRHGVEIDVVGSMQPYTHAEDDTGEWYVTLTLDEIEGRDLTMKNVRVLLRDGEELPTDLDCLSLTAKRLVAETELEVDTTEFDSFDLRSALVELLPTTVREDVMKVFDDAQSPVS